MTETKAKLLIEFNRCRLALGKPPIKRWRESRDKLIQALEKAHAHVEEKRRSHAK